MTFTLDYNKLSYKNKLEIGQFYNSKRKFPYVYSEIRQYPRYVNNYNKYKNIFNSNSNLELLDEFVVDETCVWFLYYDIDKDLVRSVELMLE